MGALDPKNSANHADAAPSAAERVRISEKRLEELRGAILKRLLAAAQEYKPPVRQLFGAELKAAARVYTDIALAQERVIELRALEPWIESTLASELRDSSDIQAHERALQLNEELVYLNGLAKLAMLSVGPFLKRSAHERGLDPSAFIRCEEHLTPATRAEAMALAERLEMMSEDEMPSQTELPELKPRDRQVWQMSFMLSMNQKQIAAELNRQYPGERWTQPRVSEALTRAKAVADKNGASELAAKVLPQVDPKSIARTYDPRKADMGSRTDSIGHEQRVKARQKAKDGDFGDDFDD